MVDDSDEHSKPDGCEKESEPSLLSILIPAYNERTTLSKCVQRVLAAPLPGNLGREIILVDDCSTDGTDVVIKDLTAAHPGIVRAFRQEHNRGKGAALRRAIQEMKGDYAIFQDADLEYDPNEYHHVLAPILENEADVVYGSRFASSPRRRVLNFHHQVGNKLLTFLSNFATGLNLTDIETCYKAFRGEILRTIPIRSNRFGIEPEITAKIARRSLVVYEVSISYYGRTYAEGKKIGWKDGLSAIYTILKYRVLNDSYEERYGSAVLEKLSGAQRFNEWVVSVISTHVGNHILEIGSGLVTLILVLGFLLPSMYAGSKNIGTRTLLTLEPNSRFARQEASIGHFAEHARSLIGRDDKTVNLTTERNLEDVELEYHLSFIPYQTNSLQVIDPKRSAEKNKEAIATAGIRYFIFINFPWRKPLLDAVISTGAVTVVLNEHGNLLLRTNLP
jgi:glycosyltransferase involved in cell wall biosynthesis